MIFNRNRRYLDNLECLASLLCLTVLISSGIFYFLSLAMTSSMIVIQLKVFFSNFKFKLLSCQIKKILKFAMKKKIFCGSNKSRTKEFNVMHNEYIFFLVFFFSFSWFTSFTFYTSLALQQFLYSPTNIFWAKIKHTEIVIF